MNNVKFFSTANTLTVIAAGVRYSMPTSDSRHDRLLERLLNGQLPAADVPAAFAAPEVANIQHLDGYVVIGSHGITVTSPTGEAFTIGGSLLDRLQSATSANVRQNLVNFLRRCAANPRPEAIVELYDFLDVSRLPITARGTFLAYKRVNKDFTDIRSGTFDNSPGSVVEMARDLVDDNRENTCSTGLHFAAYDYLDNYASADHSNTVVVEIDPADVVAIPADYNNMKGRTCRYTVLAQMADVTTERIERPWQDTEDEDDDDDDEGCY